MFQEQPDKNQEADLDDDEDQKNPAYIPRKGAFYEHDTRDYEEQKDEKMYVNIGVKLILSGPSIWFTLERLFSALMHSTL